MDLRPIKDTPNLSQVHHYNQRVTHIMQSWQWGEFRKSLGTPALRYGIYKKNKLEVAFQLTLHKIPLINQFVGYLPKGPFPDKDLVKALKKIGKEQNCAFIKLEPNILTTDPYPTPSGLISSPKPLFTKYNFIVDLTKSEEELQNNMHPKTRYNTRLAFRYGVELKQRSDDRAFEGYLRLYFETTKRQGYHGHNEDYHRKAWEKLKKANMARILIATFKDIPLTAWMLLNFKDTLYYPYGGSSNEYRNVMHSNLVAWEAIKLGKKMGLKKFDMWGALGPNADPKDPFYGFHHFKEGYGGELVEYIGTYDLVLNWPLYLLFTFIDKLMPLKVFLLKLISK